jgi:hypothetical protein
LREGKKVQKSAQEYEKKGDSAETRCNVGSFEGWLLGEGVPPHHMHEFENKGVGKWAPRKCMKRKGLIFVGLA